MSGAAGFAAAVAARHRAGSAITVRVPRVGLRPPALRLAPGAAPRFDVRITQRLQLLLTRLESRTPQRFARGVAAPAGRAAERIVERIVARCQRSDAGVRAAAPGAAAAGAPRPAPAPIAATAPAPGNAPVRRVVRQSPPPEPPAAPALPAPRPPQPPPPVVIGPAELARVTSHVVEALDRRVSAWRERTGRA